MGCECLEFGGIEEHFLSNGEDYFYSNVESSDIGGDLKMQIASNMSHMYCADT